MKCDVIALPKADCPHVSVAIPKQKSPALASGAFDLADS